MTAPTLDRQDTATISLDLCADGLQDGSCVYCTGPETD